MNNYRKYGPYVVIAASLVLLVVNVVSWANESENGPVYGIISNVFLILAMIITIRSSSGDPDTQ